MAEQEGSSAAPAMPGAAPAEAGHDPIAELKNQMAVVADQLTASGEGVQAILDAASDDKKPAEAQSCPHANPQPQPQPQPAPATSAQNPNSAGTSAPAVARPATADKPVPKLSDPAAEYYAALSSFVELGPNTQPVLEQAISRQALGAWKDGRLVLESFAQGTNLSNQIKSSWDKMKGLTRERKLGHEQYTVAKRLKLSDEIYDLLETTQQKDPSRDSMARLHGRFPHHFGWFARSAGLVAPTQQLPGQAMAAGLPVAQARVVHPTPHHVHHSQVQGLQPNSVPVGIAPSQARPLLTPQQVQVQQAPSQARPLLTPQQVQVQQMAHASLQQHLSLIHI
eukprot:TRINITY_DN6806_c0_g1_i2.p1 TRINITY_DN6806_c0_g1~~TRINITY_DN6806_c0_g1_i2.p1  ORF type:complete len:338 (-),score=63.73 TRINITY_DN6806_c0_g1_i2:152-1165(-)